MENKGNKERTYKAVYHDKVVYEFKASSILAAKRKLSEFCGNSAELYKTMCGVYLCNGRGNELAFYVPFFCKWYNCILSFKI